MCKASRTDVNADMGDAFARCVKEDEVPCLELALGDANTLLELSLRLACQGYTKLLEDEFGEPGTIESLGRRSSEFVRSAID